MSRVKTRFWKNQEELFAALANFAMFNLDDVVHSSNCERVFKEFARQHTKTRNRLHSATVDNLAQVKYYMRRKYPNDVSARTKNRAISPAEHAFYFPESPGTACDSGATNANAIEVNDEQTNLEEPGDDNDGVLWMEAFQDLDDEDEDELDCEAEGSGADDTTGADPNTAEPGSDDDVPLKVNYKEVAERPGDLKEWPDIEEDLSESFKSWPQENAAYFKR